MCISFIISIFLIRYNLKFIKFQEENCFTDYPLITINFLLIIESISCFWRIINLFAISYEREWFLYPVFGAITEALSMYGLCFVIILIGRGWGILYMDVEKNNEIMVPVLFAVSIFGILL